MLLFLIASGLTLTFGVMGIINLAHGAFFMIGAYLAFQFTRYWGWPLPAAYAAAVLAVVLLGACVERTVLAPLADRDHLDQVLVTFGLILVFDELAVIAWGKDVQPADIPAIPERQRPSGQPDRLSALSFGARRRRSALCLWPLSARGQDAPRHDRAGRFLRSHHGARARHQCDADLQSGIRSGCGACGIRRRPRPRPFCRCRPAWATRSSSLPSSWSSSGGSARSRAPSSGHCWSACSIRSARSCFRPSAR